MVGTTMTLDDAILASAHALCKLEGEERGEVFQSIEAAGEAYQTIADTDRAVEKANTDPNRREDLESQRNASSQLAGKFRELMKWHLPAIVVLGHQRWGGQGENWKKLVELLPADFHHHVNQAHHMGVWMDLKDAGK